MNELANPSSIHMQSTQPTLSQTQAYPILSVTNEPPATMAGAASYSMKRGPTYQDLIGVPIYAFTFLVRPNKAAGSVILPQSLEHIAVVVCVVVAKDLRVQEFQQGAEHTRLAFACNAVVLAKRAHATFIVLGP